MEQGFFITGTDTGVGKTLVASALQHAYAATGKKVIGMKPVAAGCAIVGGQMRCEDVEALQAASTVQAPLSLINPYAFAAPVAPHIAAAQAGVVIDLEHIHAALLSLGELAQIVIVEGVGGFKVPLNAREDSADLAVKLKLPVILVVGMRLGCLNHALLTQAAIAASGLPLAGWVANCIDPAMQLFAENLQALQERLDCPLLAVLPWQANPRAEIVAPLFVRTCNP